MNWEMLATIGQLAAGLVVIARGGTPRAYESYNLPKAVSPNK
jgi:hypothetical protein